MDSCIFYEINYLLGRQNMLQRENHRFARIIRKLRLVLATQPSTSGAHQCNNNKSKMITVDMSLVSNSKYKTIIMTNMNPNSKKKLHDDLLSTKFVLNIKNETFINSNHVMSIFGILSSLLLSFWLFWFYSRLWYDILAILIEFKVAGTTIDADSATIDINMINNVILMQ